MFANVEVVLQEKTDALIIPREAVLEAGGETFVFVAEGKQAVRKLVTLGYEKDRMVEVLKGLAEGNAVVTRGQLLIKEGAAIRVIEGS
jgi:membrane fusion protein (multidrug efflux system)